MPRRGNRLFENCDAACRPGIKCTGGASPLPAAALAAGERALPMVLVARRFMLEYPPALLFLSQARLRRRGDAAQKLATRQRRDGAGVRRVCAWRRRDILSGVSARRPVREFPREFSGSTKFRSSVAGRPDSDPFTADAPDVAPPAMARFSSTPVLTTAAAALALLVILGVSVCAAFDMSGLMDSIRNIQSSGGALVRALPCSLRASFSVALVCKCITVSSI